MKKTHDAIVALGKVGVADSIVTQLKLSVSLIFTMAEAMVRMVLTVHSVYKNITNEQLLPKFNVQVKERYQKIVKQAAFDLKICLMEAKCPKDKAEEIIALFHEELQSIDIELKQ